MPRSKAESEGQTMSRTTKDKYLIMRLLKEGQYQKEKIDRLRLENKRMKKWFRRIGHGSIYEIATEALHFLGEHDIRIDYRCQYCQMRLFGVWVF